MCYFLVFQIFGGFSEGLWEFVPGISGMFFLGVFGFLLFLGVNKGVLLQQKLIHLMAIHLEDSTAWNQP